MTKDGIWIFEILIFWNFIFYFFFFLKKVKKTSFFGVQKKGPNLTSRVPNVFFAKIGFFSLQIAPLATHIWLLESWPRTCFYTVLVLVVGGVQSGGKKRCLIFQGDLSLSCFCAIDFRRWYNTKTGFWGVQKWPFFGIPRNAEINFLNLVWFES